MSTAGAAVNIVVGLVGLVVVVSAAFAVARASWSKSQIEALRGDRDDQAKLIEMLEHEKDRLEGELDIERNARLVLEKVVTGREVLEHIQTSVDSFLVRDEAWKHDQRKLVKDLLVMVGDKRESDTG